MTPDPVFEALPRFTPDAAGLDPAAVLFAAGKASARTPVGWKVAVAGLGLLNVVLVGWLALRAGKPAAVPDPLVVPVVVPVPVPVADPSNEVPYPVPSPWSLGALTRVGDVEELPRPAVSSEAHVVSSPLTPYAARGGVLD